RDAVSKLGKTLDPFLDTSVSTAGSKKPTRYKDMPIGYDGVEYKLHARSGDRALQLAGPGWTPPSTYGEMMDFTGSVLLEAERQNGVSGDKQSTAFGPSQITNTTREIVGPRVFGPGFKRMPPSFTNERILSKEIWDSPGEKRLGPKAFNGLWDPEQGLGLDLKQLERMKFERVEPLLYFAESGHRVPQYKEDVDQFTQRLTTRTQEIEQNRDI